MHPSHIHPTKLTKIWVTRFSFTRWMRMRHVVMSSVSAEKWTVTRKVYIIFNVWTIFERNHGWIKLFSKIFVGLWTWQCLISITLDWTNIDEIRNIFALYFYHEKLLFIRSKKFIVFNHLFINQPFWSSSNTWSPEGSDIENNLYKIIN